MRFYGERRQDEEPFVCQGFVMLNCSKQAPAFAVLLALAGCDDDTGASAATDLDGGGTRLDAGMTRVSQVSGKVLNLRDGGILDARICVVDHDEIPCATANSTGDYTMELPLETDPSEMAVHVSAVGYLGRVTLLQAPSIRGGTVWFSSIWLDDIATAAKEFGEEAGYLFPEPDRGFVRVEVSARLGSLVDNALMSGSFELTIEPPGGQRPVYYDHDAGMYDPKLTASSAWSGSGNRNGVALFAEVPPGHFEVTVPGCDPVDLADGTWIGSKPNTVAGVAIGNAITDVTALCRAEAAP